MCILSRHVIPDLLFCANRCVALWLAPNRSRRCYHAQNVRDIF